MLPEGGGITRLLPALVPLLVAGGSLMLLAALVPLTRGRQLLLALLLGAATAALAGISPGLGRKLLAFAGAVLFPILAFVLYPLSERRSTGDHGEQPRRATEKDGMESTSPWSSQPFSVVLRATVVRFAAMSLLSLLGGLAVAGLLSGRPGMVKVTEFSGIKLAQVLPVLAVAAIYTADLLGDASDWETKRRAVSARVSRLMTEPLRLWHALAGVSMLVLLVLMVLRTGNDPGVGVSPLELRFRELLDQILVRPRTKEFLFGHPALVVALALWTAGRGRSFVAPLTVAGAVGQSGMVNSFCHLHTPIALTLARTWNGLWLGLLIGLAIAFFCLTWGDRRKEKGLHHGGTERPEVHREREVEVAVPTQPSLRASPCPPCLRGGALPSSP
jgi:hypothetical protein